MCPRGEAFKHFIFGHSSDFFAQQGVGANLKKNFNCPGSCHGGGGS